MQVEKKGHKANELSLDSIGGVFVVLVAGMGIACTVSVIEYTWKSKKITRTGGGGKPSPGSVYTGGAGSGYITYRTFIVQGGQAWMTANVGDQQEPSTVTLHYNPGMYTTITAERFVSLCCVFSVSISVS